LEIIKGSAGLGNRAGKGVQIMAKQKPIRRRAALRKRVEFWDFDEPEAKGGIVTLHYGWSFEYGCHEGVRGFDSLREAWEAIADASPCDCKECKGVSK
jgi:hypothetical protein